MSSIPRRADDRNGWATDVDPPIPEVQIAGLNVQVSSLRQAVNAIAALWREGGVHLVASVNVDISVRVRADPSAYGAFSSARFRYADGAPILLVARLLGVQLPERVTGADLLPALCSYSARHGLRVVFLGGVEGVAEEASRRLTRKYPGLDVVGTISPPFGFESDSEQDALVLRRLQDLRPDLVFVSLGSPKQELWIEQRQASLPSAVYMGVGGAIDFASGRVRRAPMLLQRLGLEWAFRLITDWRRLWRRYLVRGPLFSFVVLEALRIRSRSRKTPRPVRMVPRSAGGPRVAYVCGALRVTTDERSKSVGPRAHVVGFLSALERASVEVTTYLAGDEAKLPVPSTDGAPPGFWGRSCRPLAADITRLVVRRMMHRSVLRRIPPDLALVYERQATFQDLGRPLSRRGIPWVVESNGPFWYEASAERGRLALPRTARRLELQAYRDADLVVCVSEVLKDILVREASLNPDHVLVLPNAVDPSRFDPANVSAKRLHAGFTVGFVGYLAGWSGLDMLIDAVADGAVVDISVTIVGDGPAGEQLRAQVVERGLQDRVTFVGHVPWSDVPSYLAGFDVGYSGQRSMAIGGMYHSPLKLYEYMAMGVPVLAADHMDARELVEGSGTGRVFASDDLQSLVYALVNVANIRDNNGAVARRTRQHVVENHSWDARIRTLLDKLQDERLLSSLASRQVTNAKSPG